MVPHRLTRHTCSIGLSLLLVLALPAGPAGAARRHRVRWPAPGAQLVVTATAYCQDGITESGVSTHTGIAAADPAWLPVGSVVRIEGLDDKYNGIYTVMDTGKKVVPQQLDLFLHDCDEAKVFGRQEALVRIMRRGWSPQASAKKEPGKD